MHGGMGNSWATEDSKTRSLRPKALRTRLSPSCSRPWRSANECSGPTTFSHCGEAELCDSFQSHELLRRGRPTRSSGVDGAGASTPCQIGVPPPGAVPELPGTAIPSTGRRVADVDGEPPISQTWPRLPRSSLLLVSRLHPWRPGAQQAVSHRDGLPGGRPRVARAG
jgi:hypothetical protein